MNVHVVCGLLLLGVCNVAALTIMETLASRYEVMSFSSLVRRAGLESLLNTGMFTRKGNLLGGAMNVHVMWGLLLLGVYDVAAQTIMEALASRYDVMSFSSLVRRAGLESLLNKGNYTVFVPVDAAFQLLPEQMITRLYQKENLLELKALVKYHIVPYTGNMHWTGEKVNTLASKPVRMVTYPHNKVTVVNGVVLTETNLSVSNGQIFLLSSTLSPPSFDVAQDLYQEPNYSSFLTAAALSGMTSKLKEDNITVFAPYDLAFTKMDKNKTDALFNNIPMLRGVYYTGGLYDNEKLYDDNSKYDNTYTIHQFGKDGFRVSPFDGTFLTKNWLATNGVIHAITGVKYTWPFYRHIDKIIG